MDPGEVPVTVTVAVPAVAVLGAVSVKVDEPLPVSGATKLAVTPPVADATSWICSVDWAPAVTVTVRLAEPPMGTGRGCGAVVDNENVPTVTPMLVDRETLPDTPSTETDAGPIGAATDAVMVSCPCCPGKSVEGPVTVTSELLEE